MLQSSLDRGPLSSEQLPIICLMLLHEQVCTSIGADVILDQLQLLDVRNIEVSTLPYGKQRLLEIAIGLALRPRVLILDEPVAGIPSSESQALFSIIAQLPGEVTILFIEQDMDLVFRFASRITVLTNGRVPAEGSPAEIAAEWRSTER